MAASLTEDITGICQQVIDAADVTDWFYRLEAVSSASVTSLCLAFALFQGNRGQNLELDKPRPTLGRP